MHKGEIKEVLKELGLTNNEAEVYLALLQNESITANVLAGKSGLHRQAVYDALERLLEKGFASFVVKDGKRHFQAMQPGRILDYLHQQEENFRSVLPELDRLHGLPREDTHVEVFKGKESSIARTIYRDIVGEFKKKPGEVLISGVDERKFIEADRIALEQYLRELRKLKCTERILIEEGDTRVMEGQQSQYRYLPKDSFTSTPIFSYSDKLTVLVWGMPNYAIIIKNRNLAEAYKKQFNLIWKNSRKVEKK